MNALPPNLPPVASCEWHAGSNRSLVDPVVAVDQLTMSDATRAQLKAKIAAHQFDDVVRIRWASITSDTNQRQYEAVITRMNFGAAGRLCETVTRTQWSVEHEEAAIVYVVDGRAWGFASVCGNLFELTLREPEPHADSSTNTRAQAQSADTPAGGLGGAPESGEDLTPALYVGPSVPVLGLRGDVGGFSGSGPGGIGIGGGGFGGGGGGVGSCDCKPPPPCDTLPPVAPAVPEPATWWMLVGGISAICLFSWLRGRRP